MPGTGVKVHVLISAMALSMGVSAPAWATSITELVSVGPGGAQANGTSSQPSISADGRFVAFVSDAINLVPGDTNNLDDVFVRDRQTGKTRRVSLGPGGVQQIGQYGSSFPSISADGQYVTFMSYDG